MAPHLAQRFSVPLEGRSIGVQSREAASCMGSAAPQSRMLKLERSSSPVLASRDPGPHTRFFRDPDLRRLSPSEMVQFWAVFLIMELEEEGIYLLPQLQATGQS